MENAIASLTEKYKDSFEITYEQNRITIMDKKPRYRNQDKYGGPLFLYYTIDGKDSRPNAGLEDRSRSVWLRDGNGKGIQNVIYCGGLGIWEVAENSEPMAFSDLSADSKSTVEKWLGDTDKYIFKSIPELKEILD